MLYHEGLAGSVHQLGVLWVRAMASPESFPRQTDNRLLSSWARGVSTFWTYVVHISVQAAVIYLDTFKVGVGDLLDVAGVSQVLPRLVVNVASRLVANAIVVVCVRYTTSTSMPTSEQWR